MQTIYPEVANGGELKPPYTLKWLAERAPGMRHNLALSVQNVGCNPRQMLAEFFVGHSWCRASNAKRPHGPQNTAENRQILTSHLSLCVQAIIDKLRQTLHPINCGGPLRGSDIVTICARYYQYDSRAKDSPKWSEKIRSTLYDVLVKCGKCKMTQRRLSRPILKTAKALKNRPRTPNNVATHWKAIQVAQEIPLTKEKHQQNGIPL